MNGFLRGEDVAVNAKLIRACVASPSRRMGLSLPALVAKKNFLLQGDSGWPPWGHVPALALITVTVRISF